MVKFEDVKNQTTEDYFNGNQFSIDAFNKKYPIEDGETYVQAIKRVCDYIASAEATPDLQKYWSERWFDEIYNDYWQPAGSIMQGAAHPNKISLMNCFGKETKFITDKGTKTFEDFNHGDSVNILNNMGGFLPATIKNFGKQKLYKLIFSRNGVKKEIYSTLNHSWRVINKGNIIKKTSKELETGEIIPYIKRKRVSNLYCPIGFIHGLVFGDGTYRKVHDYCELTLCGDSKEYIKYFSGFKWKISKNSKGHIIIGNLPNYMKQLPDFEKINQEYILGFLIGLFASDGSCCRGRASISHNNFENLEKIKNAAESIGIYSCDIKCVRNTNILNFQNKTIIKKEGNYKLYNLLFYKDCMFEEFFVKTIHKNDWFMNVESKTKKKFRANWKFLSIEETDRFEDVWCVEESKHHNFTLSCGINTGNCTTIAMPDDSLEGIFRYNAYRVAKTAAYRQGLGVDFSKLRPKGVKVNNSANESEGVIHWMKFIDSIGYFVGQKGRIPAMLFSLHCTSLDLEEFITVKSDYTKIQNANISVQCTNKFYQAAIHDKDWELRFEIPEIKKGDKIYLNEDWDDLKLAEGKDEKGSFKISKFNRKKELFTRTTKARKILELIAKNMFNNAEPGIQNIDIARKYSNSDAVGYPIISTNACSEQYLNDGGLCVLSSLKCDKFFSVEKGYDKEQLQKISISLVRFLDNVVEMELRDGRYANYQQKISLEQLRRIGAGYTDIAGLLLQNKLEYGSEDGNKLVEKFTDDYNYFMYKYSIELGKEKGSFGAFSKEKYLQSEFIKNLMKRHPDLEFEYMRNVCISSLAPTGTLSLMFRELVLGYGVEPGWFLGYWKRTRISGKYEYYYCVPSVVRKMFEEAGYPIPMKSDTIKDDWNGSKGKVIQEFIEANKDKVGIKFKSSLNIKPLEKLDLMSRVMKNIDSSISVTYMLPENSDWKDIYEFILEAWRKEVKSIAAFPDKKMYGIVSFVSFKDLALKLKEEGTYLHPQNFTEDELKELNLNNENITVSHAPKRPEKLEADIYSVTVKEQKFVIALGLLNGAPYEIFAGHMNGLNFKFQYKKGVITKLARGKYKLEIGEDIEITDFTEQFTPVEMILCRLVSSNLRHGIPIKFIVEQLQKATDDITSLASAISRILKKYIVDGETAHGIECPQCKSTNSLIYKDGCVECGVCQWTKC